MLRSVGSVDLLKEQGAKLKNIHDLKIRLVGKVESQLSFQYVFFGWIKLFGTPYVFW